MTPDDLKAFDCTLAREQRDREIADLRALLAQQAARADGLQAEVDALTDKLIKSGNAKADAKEERDAALSSESRLREALKKSRELAVAAANADVDAAVSLEPGSDVFGAAGIAKKVLVVEAKRRWAQYDNCLDAALAGGDHEDTLA
jgi:chromosome segregation ATPase